MTNYIPLLLTANLRSTRLLLIQMEYTAAQQEKKK